MRLKPEIKEFIIKATDKYFPGAKVYLFGSRVDDEAKGGDLDLLLLSDEKITSIDIRKFRISFYTEFGWQKIDLVNFRKNEEATFKSIALKNAVLING